MKKKSELVKLAIMAAKTASKAAEANRKWCDAFEKEFGHNQIPDALVEVIDYSSGDVSMLTEDFIRSNSEPGRW